MATFLEQSKFIISSDLAGASTDQHGEDILDPDTDYEVRQFSVPEGLHAQRLDRILASLVPEFSRSYLQQLVDAGLVRLGATVVTKSSLRLRSGDLLAIELRPTPQTQAFKPESIPLNVVFEDAHLLVIDKPAGLVVHPAPGNWGGTLLNALLARDPGASLLPRAGIVHRLDKDTSGLMVVARSRQSMDALVQRIAAREVKRQYLALGQRRWSGPEFRQVEVAVGRDPRNRLRMAVVDLNRNSGKLASTGIRLLQNSDANCFVECTLQTGRTHQIRVHMASLGHPLVGDVLYGGAPAAGLTRQALHAFRLAFKHPVTEQPLAFFSQLPEDICNAMQNLGLSYNHG
jgi:23S rRNA pseudouridine1911/1915/1917 synthase